MNHIKIADRYILEEKVGEGSYSVVFRSFDEQEKRKVAIKEMKYNELPEDEAQDAQRIFFNEINILKSLHHPNLPKVYDFFIFQGRHYMVMEWCEGRDLKSREDYYGDQLITEREALNYMRQVCDALIYLQYKTRRVIYKDLKPSNIIVNQYGKVKLIDFGTARHYSPEKKKDTMILGTPGYAAPEAYTGIQTDLSADVYSFGATFYHLLTGEEPFQFKFNFPDPRTFNPEIGNDVAELLMDCLKNRDERIKDAFQLRKRVIAVKPHRKPVVPLKGIGILGILPPEFFASIDFGSFPVSPAILPVIFILVYFFFLINALINRGLQHGGVEEEFLPIMMKGLFPLILATISMFTYMLKAKKNAEDEGLSLPTLSDNAAFISVYIFFAVLFILGFLMLIL